MPECGHGLHHDANWRTERPRAELSRLGDHGAVSKARPTRAFADDFGHHRLACKRLSFCLNENLPDEAVVVKDERQQCRDQEAFLVAFENAICLLRILPRTARVTSTGGTDESKCRGG